MICKIRCRKWWPKLLSSFPKQIQCILKTCSFDFKIGIKTVDYASVYRYLGVHLNEQKDSTVIAITLSKAGGRALGAATMSYKKCNHIKMLDSKPIICGLTVLDYCSRSGVSKFSDFKTCLTSFD